MIPIARPMIDREEREELLTVLDSGILASGEWVGEFEEAFASRMGALYGIATSSGTTALHVALMALGIGPMDRVVTTPFTFIASSNAILFCGGEPLFADIDQETFNLDPEALYRVLKKDPQIKALIIVHLYGHPAPMKEILELVEEFDLLFIEDCAQAHGALYEGRPVGSFGHLSAFSFYPTKNMTTGEGGMILTSQEDLMVKCRSLINHGESSRYNHQELGYNFRMTNMAAALGKVQLKKLDSFNQRREENGRYYTSCLKDLPGLITPTTLKDCNHVFHQYTIRVKEREKMILRLQEEGIGYGIYYPTPVHHQPLYHSLGYGKYSYPVAERMAKEVLSLPVHPSLSEKALNHIVDVVTSTVKSTQKVF